MFNLYRSDRRNNTASAIDKRCWLSNLASAVIDYQQCRITHHLCAFSTMTLLARNYIQNLIIDHHHQACGFFVWQTTVSSFCKALSFVEKGRKADSDLTVQLRKSSHHVAARMDGQYVYYTNNCGLVLLTFLSDFTVCFVDQNNDFAATHWEAKHYFWETYFTLIRWSISPWNLRGYIGRDQWRKKYCGR